MQLHPENRAGCSPCFSATAHPSFLKQSGIRKHGIPQQEFLPLTTNFSILLQIRKVFQFSSASTEVLKNRFLIHALSFLKGTGKGKGVPVGCGVD